MSPDAKQEIVRTALEEIWAEKGVLRPEDVIERARPKAAPLHPFITWDNRLAADARRLDEARALIRLVRVRFEKARDGEIEDLIVRRWIAPSRVGLEPEDGYQAEEEVRMDPTRRAVLLRSMEREISALHRRYRHLAEYWDLLDELSARREETG